MWISSITCGVKIELWPSKLVLRSGFFLLDGISAGSLVSFGIGTVSLRAVLFARIDELEDQFLFGRLKIVVVPELPAGDDLLHVLDAFWRLKTVHLELAFQPLPFELRHLPRHGVDSQAGDFTADIDRAVVHRVAEI